MLRSWAAAWTCGIRRNIAVSDKACSIQVGALSANTRLVHPRSAGASHPATGSSRVFRLQSLWLKLPDMGER